MFIRDQHLWKKRGDLDWAESKVRHDKAQEISSQPGRKPCSTNVIYRNDISPSSLSHCMHAALGRSWTWAEQLPPAETDPEGANSWRPSADHRPFSCTSCKFLKDLGSTFFIEKGICFNSSFRLLNTSRKNTSPHAHTRTHAHIHKTVEGLKLRLGRKQKQAII